MKVYIVQQSIASPKFGFLGGNLNSVAQIVLTEEDRGHPLKIPDVRSHSRKMTWLGGMKALYVTCNLRPITAFVGAFVKPRVAMNNLPSPWKIQAWWTILVLSVRSLNQSIMCCPRGSTDRWVRRGRECSNTKALTKKGTVWNPFWKLDPRIQ